MWRSSPIGLRQPAIPEALPTDFRPYAGVCMLILDWRLLDHFFLAGSWDETRGSRDVHGTGARHTCDRRRHRSVGPAKNLDSNDKVPRRARFTGSSIRSYNPYAQIYRSSVTKQTARRVIFGRISAYYPSSGQRKNNPTRSGTGAKKNPELTSRANTDRNAPAIHPAQPRPGNVETSVNSFSFLQIA